MSRKIDGGSTAPVASVPLVSRHRIAHFMQEEMEAKMVKITGLDKLQRNLREAQAALKEVDGDLGAVRFDPHDPASIEVAIKDVEDMVDAKLGAYATNPIIGPLIDGMKEQYRQGIIDRAAEARLANEDDAE